MHFFDCVSFDQGSGPEGDMLRANNANNSWNVARGLDQVLLRFCLVTCEAPALVRSSEKSCPTCFHGWLGDVALACNMYV